MSPLIFIGIICACPIGYQNIIFSMNLYLSLDTNSFLKNQPLILLSCIPLHKYIIMLFNQLYSYFKNHLFAPEFNKGDFSY